MFTDYVLSRVTRQVHFDLLDRNAAIDFVKRILEKSRPPGGGAVGDYFPFDEEAVNAIMSQLREITPRKVVNTMQQVIEECRLSGADPTTGSITSDILDDLDVLDAVFGDGADT
jgi:hypothetical protein